MIRTVITEEARAFTGLTFFLYAEVVEVVSALAFGAGGYATACQLQKLADVLLLITAGTDEIIADDAWCVAHQCRLSHDESSGASQSETLIALHSRLVDRGGTAHIGEEDGGSLVLDDAKLT